MRKPSPPFSELDHPRVLIIALSGIGNLLMQSPVWTCLKQANPSADITIMVAPRGTAAVLERNTDITAIFEGNPKPSLRGWAGMVRTIQQRRFDIGFVMFPGQRITSSSILFFGNVRCRIGHRYLLAGQKRSGLFLTHPVSVAPMHDVAQNLRLLVPLGIPVEELGVRYVFPIGEEDMALAKNFLDTHGRGATRFIGLHPGAHRDMGYKRWPEDRWATLADQLSEYFDATILLFGGLGERALKENIRARLRTHAVDVELPLRSTAALMRHCLFFVSNDSGLMHVAVSQNVRTFGLFGPTDERRTAPWGPNAHVIRAAGTKPTYDVARLRLLSRHKTPDPSLHALDVAMVFRAISATVSAEASVPTILGGQRSF